MFILYIIKGNYELLGRDETRFRTNIPDIIE